MKNTSVFDVLVVYSDEIATSASSTNSNFVKPFSQKSGYVNYNDTYEYFLKMCAQKSLNAAFSTSSDIIGPGKCKSYWMFKSGKWLKVKKDCYSNQIFEKFAHRNKRQKFQKTNLFLNPQVKPFNRKSLSSLFLDKHKTYKYLKHFSIPTIAVKSKDKKHIGFAVEALQKLIYSHTKKQDFSRSFILKDRFGAGGNNIYKIQPGKTGAIRNIMKRNEKISFVIQPYVNFDKGYRFKDYAGATEIRLIYLNGDLVQTYIRVAGNRDFLCNHGRGGIQIQSKNIPNKVHRSAKEIVSKLNEKRALFALDFIVSNQGSVYLLEGNASPGIDWHANFPENEKMNKKMIRLIVKELVNRVQKKTFQKDNKKESSFDIPSPVFTQTQAQFPIFQ